MFLKTVMHVPEAVTGLIGAAFIGVSFLHSVRDNRREAARYARSRDGSDRVEALRYGPVAARARLCGARIRAP